MGLDLAELPEVLRARVAAAPGAAETLAAMIAEASAAHPALESSAPAFAAHVLGHVPADADVTAHLETMNASDLGLAFACASGSGSAIAAFERRCFDELSFAIARFRVPLTEGELAQAMRTHLFVAREGRPPKIAQYGGTGDLRAWFRVVVARHLLNAKTRGPRETALDEAMLAALPAAATDPELDHVRRAYGPLLKDALVFAIAELEARERTLLRLAVCDGLGVDAIGALYGVHRATAARWVAAARERLEQATRARARALLGAKSDESVASLFRLLASQIEVSLRGHLASDRGAGE